MSKKGFTLIEILIVVAIIGILSSTILVGVGSFRARGRDARRIADLHQVQNGLELYFTKTGSYPSARSWSELTTALTSAEIGVTAVPNDPTTGWNYGYCRPQGANNQYVIAAHLEDKNNPQLSQYPASTQFPCIPYLDGTEGASEPCSKAGQTTNKYCLML